MKKQFVLSYLKARVNEIKYAYPKTETKEFSNGRIAEIKKLIELISKPNEDVRE